MTPDVSATEQQLHAAATQMGGGLTDFGPQDYLPGLRALLDSMLRDMQFSEIGRQFGMGTIAGTLAARLHTEHGWKQRPDYRRVEIRRPLVITGIPRTGTTALHKLLVDGPADSRASSTGSPRRRSRGRHAKHGPHIRHIRPRSRGSKCSSASCRRCDSRTTSWPTKSTSASRCCGRVSSATGSRPACTCRHTSAGFARSRRRLRTGASSTCCGSSVSMHPGSAGC